MATFDRLRTTLRSIRSWFNQQSSPVKISIGLIATGLASFLAIFFPDLEPLERYPSWVRLAVVVFLFVSLFWSLIGLWSRGERVDELSKKNEDLKAELDGKTQELQQVEAEKLSLLDMDELIWVRPDLGSNQFVPLQSRKTVIVSMLNLKGGVGKTTLTANLGACLAKMDKPLRTLIVDLDFQGTLSDMSLEQGTLILLRQTKSTVSSLLADSATFESLATLATNMTRVEGARIVCAHDRLDMVDFRLQAQFFLDPTREVRFLFQSVFHDENIKNHFDLVIFDCPPRLTTSTVNALTCSDYVIVPTKLDRSSVTAVPRTLKWMASMGKAIQAKPIGIIANETLGRGGELISNQGNAYKDLCDRIPAAYGKIVFESTVGFSNKIAHTKSVGAVSAIEPEGQMLFKSVAQELRQRIGI